MLASGHLYAAFSLFTAAAFVVPLIAQSPRATVVRQLLPVDQAVQRPDSDGLSGVFRVRARPMVADHVRRW
jgi:hypothetical protein